MVSKLSPVPSNEAAKAAALEAADKAAAQLIADKLAAKEASLLSIEKLGGEYRTAKGAKTSAGYIFNAGCRAGIFTEADAAAVYARFAKGHNAAAVTVLIGNEDIAVSTEVLADDDASKISKWKNFGRWQILHYGLDWFERVARIHAGIAYQSRKDSLYNALASATSNYCDAAKKAAVTDADVRAGKFDVDDATIAGWLTRPPEAEKGKSDKTDLQRAVIAAQALNKAAKPGAISGLMDLVEAINQCLAHAALTAKMTPSERLAADKAKGYATPDELLRNIAA